MSADVAYKPTCIGYREFADDTTCKEGIEVIEEEFPLFDKQSFYRNIEGIGVVEHFSFNPVDTFEPEGIEVVDDVNVDTYKDTEGVEVVYDASSRSIESSVAGTDSEGTRQTHSVEDVLGENHTLSADASYKPTCIGYSKFADDTICEEGVEVIEEFHLFNKQFFHSNIEGMRVVEHIKINPVAIFESDSSDRAAVNDLDKKNSTNMLSIDRQTNLSINGPFKH